MWQIPPTTTDNIEVRDFDRVRQAAMSFRPEAIINATGIVKQRAESAHSIPSIEINALLPHRIAVLCQEIGARARPAPSNLHQELVQWLARDLPSDDATVREELGRWIPEYQPR
jgi:hypothetical protein